MSMKDGDYSKKPLLRALHIVGLVALLGIAGVEAQPTEAAQTLVIDATRTQRKVYLCEISHERLLVKDVFGEQRIRWIAANSRGQAIYAHSEPAGSAVWRMDLMGVVAPIPIEDPSKLPAEPDADLSPDGTRLCFRRTDTDDPTSSIEVLDINVGDIDEVFSADGLVSPPSWSPDGMSVAYYFGDKTAAVDDSFSVGISEPAGNGWNHRMVAPPSKLASRSPIRPKAPLWGPHGKTLVFQARYREDERGLQVYMVSTDGNDLVRLCDPAGTPSSHSAGKILYSEPKEGVFWVDPNKREATKLFIKKGVFYPKLSPDGKLVAYSDSEGVIFVVDPDGSNPRKIVDTANAVPLGEFYWLFVGTGTAGTHGIAWWFWVILIVTGIVSGAIIVQYRKVLGRSNRSRAD